MKYFESKTSDFCAVADFPPGCVGAHCYCRKVLMKTHLVAQRPTLAWSCVDMRAWAKRVEPEQVIVAVDK